MCSCHMQNACVNRATVIALVLYCLGAYHTMNTTDNTDDLDLSFMTPGETNPTESQRVIMRPPQGIVPIDPGVSPLLVPVGFKSPFEFTSADLTLPHGSVPATFPCRPLPFRYQPTPRQTDNNMLVRVFEPHHRVTERDKRMLVREMYIREPRDERPRDTFAQTWDGDLVVLPNRDNHPPRERVGYTISRNSEAEPSSQPSDEPPA